MSDNKQAKRYALISVSDKTRVVELAKAISGSGRTILSTGGTLKALLDGGVEALSVTDITESDEILGGRVKTLHPKLHGGLLYRRDLPEHVEEAGKYQLPNIDFAVINLYPFEATIARQGVTVEEAIEQIDIGGPAMIRASAKNAASVAVVTSPDQYDEVIEALASDSQLPADLLRRLGTAAFKRTASYDMAIAKWMSGNFDDEIEATAQRPQWLTRDMSLRYGENPQQSATLYREQSAPSLGGAQILQGKALSYNNILDTDAAIAAVREHQEPAVVVVKHTNPCGVGRSADSILEAWQRARAGDPVSAFGGIVAANREVEAAMATELASMFLEVVTAPSFSEEARSILAEKSRLRLLEWPAGGFSMDSMARDTFLGTLVQDVDPAITAEESFGKVVTKRQPTDAEREALAFMWRVVKHVRSNAIVIGSAERTFGIGAGQMSRVDAVGLAITKATGPVEGSVLASDAFFPFADGLQRAIDAGVSAVIQPGGSMRDEEVIKAADDAGIAMLMTGVRHFRH